MKPQRNALREVLGAFTLSRALTLLAAIIAARSLDPAAPGLAADSVFATWQFVP